MRDRGGNDFGLDDEDMEAMADLALGLSPEIVRQQREDDERARRMEKIRRVGLSLCARSAMSNRRKRVFLKTLAETGIVSRSAAAAGWTASTAYSFRKSDAQFKDMWDNAMSFATDSLEFEARRRAQHGVEKPVYQQGKLVGYVREYSDPLLVLLLKAHRKDLFGDQQKLEHNHKGGVLVVPGVSSEDAWEKAAAADQAPHRANQGDEVDPLK